MGDHSSRVLLLQQSRPVDQGQDLPEEGHWLLLQRLRVGGYDAVVWGSYTRSADHHLEEAVVKAYAGQPHRLWLCDGADSYSGWPVGGAGPWAALRLNATVFVREHVNIPL